MKVCITEKPSVARDIAKVLGASSRHDGYFEGNGYQVTWTFGHLCTLKDPADYKDEWKRWSLGALPMIPPKFGIKLIENEGYKKQFSVIKSLVDKADEVINCGDAGQEGELIQRWVLQKAENKCPVKRLWISSLTDASIKEGFENLRDSKDFDNLYFAGLSRAIGDWLLGLNSTRLYSLRYRSHNSVILSVGRVQTPTLAMLVDRQREIESFNSKEFWEIRIKYRDVWFNLTPAKRFDTEEEARQAVMSMDGRLFEITDIENKKGRESAPRLFDLTSLQVECNNKWGWSADETLKLIQSLYEKKLTTYPRVDTTYLSEDIYPQIPDIMAKLTHYRNYTGRILESKISKSKRIFDNSKVTDHHAIIPTGESPSVLTDARERQLFHLIAMRFIANFYEDCTFLATIVQGTVGEHKFKATGKIIEKPGWREILKPEAQEKNTEEEDGILPEFSVGEKGPFITDIQKKTTQPPKYFTEATLLKAMESAGRNVDNEELREALKENGIGRPSTRSSIIETLIKRGYVQRQKKRLVATEAGKTLIGTITDDLLKSAKLTGIWENRLRRIENGDYSPAEFIDKLKAQLRDIITGVLNDTSGSKIVVDTIEETKATKNKVSKRKTVPKKGTKNNDK